MGCPLFRVTGLLDRCPLLYHTPIWWRAGFAGFLGERCLNQDFQDNRIFRITDEGPILVPWIHLKFFWRRGFYCQRQYKKPSNSSIERADRNDPIISDAAICWRAGFAGEGCIPIWGWSVEAEGSIAYGQLRGDSRRTRRGPAFGKCAADAVASGRNEG